tara:strand:+ start:14462 stop:15247 length:786 start_codon:yes stop_codon:yes gene_type:complete
MKSLKIYNMATVSTMIAGAGLVMGVSAQNKAARLAAEQQQSANDIAQQQLEFQKEQQAKLDKQKDIYAAIEFTNPYEGFADLYRNQENVMEDLSVSTEATQLKKRMLDQQQANILDKLQTAAGSSGLSSTVQQLVNQGQIATSAVIAEQQQQERQNQLLKAKEKSRLGMLALTGEQIEAGGDAMLQEAESARQATLLGMQYGSAAGANQAVQQANQNLLAAQQMGVNIQSDRAGMFMDAGQFLLENDINLGKFTSSGWSKT